MSGKGTSGGSGLGTAAGLAGLFAVTIEVVNKVFGPESVKQFGGKFIDKMSLIESLIEVERLIANKLASIKWFWLVFIPSIGKVVTATSSNRQQGGGDKGGGQGGSKGSKTSPSSVGEFHEVDANLVGFVGRENARNCRHVWRALKEHALQQGKPHRLFVVIATMWKSLKDDPDTRNLEEAEQKMGLWLVTLFIHRPTQDDEVTEVRKVEEIWAFIESLYMFLGTLTKFRAWVGDTIHAIKKHDWASELEALGDGVTQTANAICRWLESDLAEEGVS